MLIDITMPIKSGAVFRPGTPPVEIAVNTFHHISGGQFKTVMISMPAHTATHIDLVFKERQIPPERMITRGKLFDVTDADTGCVRLSDMHRQVDVMAGDTIIFRTDWSRYAGMDKYYKHPELSPEVLQWLISKKINAVGIDAPGLARDRTHGEFDKLMAENNIFVIENLANLKSIPKIEFTVYCFPLKIKDIDAIPARVLVEIDE